MCGLAGIVDLRGLDGDAVRPDLARALERLRPRGPDQQGTWLDRHCALASARLAIIDLSPGGEQPMARHGRVLAYNGEIYNFAALRKELEALGHRFESHSDTEVLLCGWRAWGAALLPRLTGMFAFALWTPGENGAAGELVLARDRFGKKPLLYAQRNGRIAFASDLIALRCLDDAARGVDPDALRLLFALRYVPEPLAILDGVRKLPAGHLARFDADGLAVERWYDLAAARPEPYVDEARAAEDLRQRFDAAVADRLVSDVPLGAFLSGGIDSALVVASMACHAGSGRVRTFTLGFEGVAEYYEERPAAAALANFVGTEHHELPVTADAARAALDALFTGLDEPFADSSALPTFLLSRETRRHVTVALSGDGGDEVFGGYRKYQGELQAERYRRLPEVVRQGVVEPLVGLLPESKSHPVLEAARRARRFVGQAGKDATGRQAGWARMLDDSALDALLLVPSRGGAADVETLYAEARAGARDDDAINAMLAADMAIGLVGDMLVKIDRASMANSLEVRCPFLDQRVVECAAAMPGTFKLAPGEGKRILRRAFADRVPADLFKRPKKGFELPIAKWLTNELADLTRAAIDPERLRRQGLFRPAAPQRWWDALASGRRDTSEALWTLVAYQAWEAHHDIA